MKRYIDIFSAAIILVLACCLHTSCGSGGSDQIAVSDSTVSSISPVAPDCQTGPTDEAADGSMAFTQVDTLWNAFRHRFPFHIQTVGATEIQSDKSCVILVSEPTPSATAEKISALFNCFSHKVIAKTHTVGYDGWVKDIIITVAGIDESQLNALKKKLNQYLYDTEYGAYCLALGTTYDASYNPALKEQVNFQIAPNELENWFCGSKAIEFEGGTIPKLLGESNTSSSKLFYSKKRGFVAWILAANSNLTNETETIRKFALDADLMLGAIELNGKLAIIGRERVASVFDLPPLRTETILQLAMSNSSELAQSYERMNIMACKLTDGRDWAPIYLSDELLNTEYGSLLNITDQLLKSWSQNGLTSYENFIYKRPIKWAFEQDLLQLMTAEFNNSQVTFNWNTAGAVYQYNKGLYNILGLNRIGSLPVSYIPDEESSESNNIYKNVEPYEQKGYNFFSGSNDANLVRAAQYAAIYQIFKAYNITSYGQMTSTSFNTFAPLESLASRFISKLESLSNEEIESLANKALSESLEKDRYENNPLFEVYFNEEKRKIINDIKSLQEILGKLNEDPSKDRIIRLLVNRNSVSALNDNMLTRENLRSVQKISQALSKALFLKWYFPLLQINPDSLIRDYVAYNSNSNPIWIKTPSIVVSWNKDRQFSYGGHNIDAAILKVEASTSVERGSIKLENGIIKINPEDEAGLNPLLLRKLGVEAKNAKLKGITEIREFHFSGGPPKPPRDINTVFANAELPPDAPRGFINGVHDVLTVKKNQSNTYWVGNKEFICCGALQRELFENNRDKKIAIEFIDFNEDAATVRLKGVELEIQEKDGITGRFRKLDPKEMVSLAGKKESSINRFMYVFEKDPVTGIGNNGNEIIQATLAKRDNSSHIFVFAEAKSKNVFQRVKDAFRKAFAFCKNNDADFIRETFNEMAAAGLNKNDFAVVLSNSSDCVVCKTEKTKDCISVDFARVIFDNKENEWEVK